MSGGATWCHDDKNLGNDRWIMADDYSASYSEDGFWDKLKGFAKTAGREVVEKSLWLWYALQKPETPAWAKSVIVGALGYFISPVDAVPDITPVVGYADDLGVLTLAVATVSVYIDDDVKAKAKQKWRDWFGGADGDSSAA